MCVYAQGSFASKPLHKQDNPVRLRRFGKFEHLFFFEYVYLCDIYSCVHTHTHTQTEGVQEMRLATPGDTGVNTILGGAAALGFTARTSDSASFSLVL